MIRKLRNWFTAPATPRFMWWCAVTATVVIGLVIVLGLSGCDTKMPSTRPTESPQGPIERTPIRG